MAEPISTRVGHAIAKVLRIDLAPTPPLVERDETTVYSYFEHAPTAGDWFRGHTPTSPQARRYIWNLFPFLHWVGSYSTQGLIGDLVAGEMTQTKAA
jgi:sodium-independent sulfate anion transporter 11